MLFDPVALKQILSNLVSNAIKFTSHGEVEVALYQAESTRPEYVLEVSDSGVGLTAEQQQAIFEPFIQVDQGSNRASGTGLGLNICRRLAVMRHRAARRVNRVTAACLCCASARKRRA